MEMDEIKKRVLSEVDPVTKKQEETRRKKENIRTLLEFLLLALIIVVSLTVIWGLARVQGDSMYPTLHDRDVVFYKRLGNSYQTGDVVIVNRPGNTTYVKRVVAVAGDVVNIEGGVLFVNGKELAFASDYGETILENGEVQYPLRIGDGEIFVLGDNRENSEDSRAFGSIQISDVKGKLLFYFGRVKSPERVSE